MTNWADSMTVTVPEGESGSVKVQRFTVPKESLEGLRLAFQGRPVTPGDYTRLLRNGLVWMSDTPAEKRDHLEAATAIRKHGGRVLIGGLGLGMILQVALREPTVSHIDVVELDPDVIKLIGPHYEAMAVEFGKTLTIFEADLFAIRWPAGTRWNVAYFDVWADACTDNLDEMAKLRRSYGRRSDWCDCWGRLDLLRRRRQERAYGW